jgi:hypothetical protein
VLHLLLTLACSDPEPRLCNGAEQLCERPVDQVTFAATHIVRLDRSEFHTDKLTA